jgi:hypothetical protein
MANGSVAASSPSLLHPLLHPLHPLLLLLLLLLLLPLLPPPLPPPLALVPTKGQPLKGRVPPGLGLSPLWTPNAAAPMENQDDDDDDE